MLPTYSRKEELFNAVTHAVGIIMGFLACILYWQKATDTSGYIGALIYGVSIIILYTGSTVYHALTPGIIKKIFRVIDHAAIYVLIAGTSITIMVVGILKNNALLGGIMIGISLAVAATGLILTFIDQEKYKTVQMVLYMVLGWMCIVLIYPLYKYCEESVLLILFVLLGGVVYTVGTTFLALGKKKKYFHSIFHLFVLAGTLIHFIGIYNYLY